MLRAAAATSSPVTSTGAPSCTRRPTPAGALRVRLPARGSEDRLGAHPHVLGTVTRPTHRPSSPGHSGTSSSPRRATRRGRRSSGWWSNGAACTRINCCRFRSTGSGRGSSHREHGRVGFRQAAAEDGIVLGSQSFDWLCEQGHVGLERVAKARRDPGARRAGDGGARAARRDLRPPERRRLGPATRRARTCCSRSISCTSRPER